MLENVIGGIGALFFICGAIGLFRYEDKRLPQASLAFGALLIILALLMGNSPQVAALGYQQNGVPSCGNDADKASNWLIQSVLRGETSGWAFVSAESVIHVSGNLAPTPEEVVALENALRRWGWQPEPANPSGGRTWKEPSGGFIKCPGGGLRSTDRFIFPLTIIFIIIAIINWLIRRLRSSGTRQTAPNTG